MSEIKLIVFDLWHTLAYKAGDKNHSSLREMKKKTGINIPLNDFIDIFERVIQTKKWDNEREAYSSLCRVLKIRPTDKNISFLVEARNKVIKKPKLYVNSIPMIKKLKKLGFKIGIISNSSVFAINEFEKTNFLKYIDYPIFSFDVGMVKPNLKIYKKMFEIAKVRPNEVLMVGDSLEHDVKAPSKLGIKSIHYRGYLALKKSLCDLGIIL